MADIAAANILDSYARSTKDLLIGARVTLMPLFDDAGQYNRDGKRIYVKVERPIGKYQLFTREKDGYESLYLMTASGRIDRTSQYFSDDWDEEKRKHVNHRPTEDELDELIPRLQERFEQDLADPEKWAMYQHAAIFDRLDVCDEHNAPVREQRNKDDAKRREKAEQERQKNHRQKQEKYDARIDEIAAAVGNDETVSVGYNEYEYDGKNPVLDLFKLYGVKLPLRTQGWVNTGLAEINADGYRYYKSKHKGDSTKFNGYLSKLRVAIKEMPIEQKRVNTIPRKEVRKTLEYKNYEMFAEMFPDFLNRKYSYLRLESGGFEPLSLEWIGDNKISVMHTYTMNDDLMYDPMIEFELDIQARTMTATMIEQSMPPLYQVVDANGDGWSIDGKGNEHAAHGLQSQINDFATYWLTNIGKQGYMPEQAIMEVDGDDVRITFDAEGNPILPELLAAEHDEKDLDTEHTIMPELMPDIEVSESDRDLFGYTDNLMLPLTKERALELFDEDYTVYLLFPGNTEEIAFIRSDISDHFGLFGIERGDWITALEFRAMANMASTGEAARESDLLFGNGDKFGIYQIRDGITDARDFSFASMRELEAHGITPERANYELVYVAQMQSADTQAHLNDIYEVFNTNRPGDFTGHSLSVSDVIVLRQGGEVSAHYVDSVGFVELSSFTGEELTPEQQNDGPFQSFSQVGKSSPPTVAELEAEVQAGNSISLMDLSQAVHAEQEKGIGKNRTSLLEKLRENKQKAAQASASDTPKFNGREV